MAKPNFGFFVHCRTRLEGDLQHEEEIDGRGFLKRWRRKKGRHVCAFYITVTCNDDNNNSSYISLIIFPAMDD